MRAALQIFVVLLCAASAAACSAGERAPDFSLRDDGGSPWTLAQQRGKAVLLTFGFTHCADTCPATVAKLARLGGVVRGGPQNVEVAFVTVDPSRDTVSAMHRFVLRFSGAGKAPVVGLTGTPAQIEAVKREYHVWSAPAGRDIAHTAVIFLIDPQGRIWGLRDDDDSEAALAHAVREMLGTT
jgi:protein SCO1